MKYIVMECRAAYAVLMDEDSRFVMAANLNYTVGDTVSEPLLLTDTSAEASRKRIKITAKFISAAACLAIIFGTGYLYYSRNYKTYSTIIISEADVKMNVNQKGKVISIESCNPRGDEILSGYRAKGKDQLTVANEIIELSIKKGFISKDDTVSLYVSDNDSDKFTDNEDSSLSKHNIKICGLDEYSSTTIPTTETITTYTAEPETVSEQPPVPEPATPDIPEPPHERPVPEEASLPAVQPPKAETAPPEIPAAKPEDSSVPPPQVTEPASPPKPENGPTPPADPEPPEKPTNVKPPEKEPPHKLPDLKSEAVPKITDDLPHKLPDDNPPPVLK